MNSPDRPGRYSILCGVLGLYTAALLFYSQTVAFTGDEGFHLQAAQLVLSGMRPYLDFFFPQTPLNVFWNAGWMAIFGESWRVAHAVAAALTAAAVFLTADYVYRRFPEPRWKLAGAIGAGLLTGLNAMVVIYGPLAQAYGVCLFLGVAAFRVSLPAVERRGAALPAAAGLLAGTAAACTLLTAPLPAVLFLWILFGSRAGNRWLKSAAFAICTLVPWLPVLRYALVSPRVVWINLVQYHTQFRHLYWPDTTEHDFEILSAWINSGQALTLLVLAIGGILFLKYRSGWTRELRWEFYLCGWLALALAAETATAHPTFARYFVLTVPFAVIPAIAGLYAICSRLFDPSRPKWVLAVVLAIAVVDCGRTLWDRRDYYTWTDYENIARKIAKVTPPNAPLYADDHVYFVMHRKPPAGLEFIYSHKLTFPPNMMAALHTLPESEVDRQLSSGMYTTVYICEDDETYNKLGLPQLYRQKEVIEDCTLFWDRNPAK